MSDMVWIRQDELPPLTEAQMEELRRLAEDDSPIDVSDIPPLDDDFWKRARLGREVMEERRLAREARKAAAAKTAAE